MIPRFRLFFCVLSIFLTVKTALAEGPDASILALQTPQMPGTGITHQFDLTLVVFRDTPWDMKTVTDGLPEIARIYGQCRIALGAVNYVELNAPTEGSYVTYGSLTSGVFTSPEANRLARSIPKSIGRAELFQNRPVAYFVNSIVGV